MDLDGSRFHGPHRELTQVSDRQARRSRAAIIRKVDLERRKRDEQISSISGPQNDVNFGSQIRSYVLQPYQMVKDERTKLQVGDVDSVLDGDIDEFMEAFLRDQQAKLAQGE